MCKKEGGGTYKEPQGEADAADVAQFSAHAGGLAARASKAAPLTRVAATRAAPARTLAIATILSFS